MTRTALLAALAFAVSVPAAAGNWKSKEAKEKDRAAKRWLLNNPGAKIMPNRYFVQFKSGTSDVQRQQAVSTVSGFRMADFRLAPDFELVEIKGSADQVKNRLLKNPHVVSVEPESILRSMATPNETHFSSLWGMNQANDIDINAPEAWDIFTGARAFVVAVFDTGLNHDHRDLNGLFTGLYNAGNVRAATTLALPANTRSADGLTLTANANGALPAQDGVELALNDRLLVNNEWSPPSNGIYYVSSLGGASSKWILTRDPDADSALELIEGTSVFVQSGAHNGFKQFEQAMPGFLIIGRSDIQFLPLNNIWENPGEHGRDANGFDKRSNLIDDDGNGYVDDYRGWDFANDDNDPWDDGLAEDPTTKEWFVSRHGTHVSGTIGAIGLNNEGVVGVNWRVKLAPIKIFNAQQETTTCDIILALDYVGGKGIRLSNHSWGGSGTQQTTQCLYEAMSNLASKGHLFVTAAGNAANDIDYPGKEAYPAGYDISGLITVGAIEWDGAMRSTSNWGATSVDLFAPGGDILSTVQNHEYESFGGTSMAAPHVAGAAAWLWAQRPGWTPLEVKQRILEKVKPLSSLAGKSVTGGMLRLTGLTDIEPFVKAPTFFSQESDWTTSDHRAQLVAVDSIDGSVWTAATVSRLDDQQHPGDDWQVRYYNPATGDSFVWVGDITGGEEFVGDGDDRPAAIFAHGGRAFVVGSYESSSLDPDTSSGKLAPIAMVFDRKEAGNLDSVLAFNMVQHNAWRGSSGSTVVEGVAKSVAVDREATWRNIYVAGNFEGGGSTGRDIFVARLEVQTGTNGKRKLTSVWSSVPGVTGTVVPDGTRFYQGADSDEAKRIHVRRESTGADDNYTGIYVGGNSYPGGGPYPRFFIGKWGWGGGLRWSAPFTWSRGGNESGPDFGELVDFVVERKLRNPADFYIYAIGNANESNYLQKDWAILKLKASHGSLVDFDPATSDSVAYVDGDNVPPPPPIIMQSGSSDRVMYIALWESENGVDDTKVVVGGHSYNNAVNSSVLTRVYNRDGSSPASSWTNNFTIKGLAVDGHHKQAIQLLSTGSTHTIRGFQIDNPSSFWQSPETASVDGTAFDLHIPMDMRFRNHASPTLFVVGSGGFMRWWERP